MKNAVLYARATNLSDVDRQFQTMQEFLDPGANVVGRYSDLGFGRESQRPGLQEALERLQEGDVDALVVQSLDRLGRAVKDVALLASMFRIIEIPDYGFTRHDSSRSLRFTFQTVVEGFYKNL